MWLQNFNRIRDDVGMCEGSWLLDNIGRVVGDRSSALFWLDPCLDMWYLLMLTSAGFRNI